MHESAMHNVWYVIRSISAARRIMLLLAVLACATIPLGARQAAQPDSVKVSEVDNLRLALIAMTVERDALRLENADLRQQISQRDANSLIRELNNKYIDGKITEWEFRQTKEGGYEYVRKK